ncbi:MAG: hypothetical protein HY303_18570 [Candidatus Wallbacteria bacterium]|nr:hypothetical protein [Candidatus Wallbacteria bacterium]
MVPLKALGALPDLCFDAQCRGCSESTLLYHVIDPFVSHCGQSVSLGAKPDASAAQQTLPLTFRPEIVEALHDFRRARRSLGARLAEPAHRAVPRSRFSKLTLGCRACGRPFAWEEYATQLERALDSVGPAPLRIEAKIALRRSVHEPFPHWCCRPGTGGCAEAAERA